MSQRLFYDVVSRCSANNILPLTLKRLIFDDIPLMMGCSQAAITAFSFEMGCFENVNGKVVFSWRYGQPVPFQHIFIQDFSAIQCMMSLLNHDIFLKYLLFNFFPVLATKATFSHSLADIFSIVPFSNDQLQKFIVFLYNALTERHFVGKLNNPASYFMERRIIHFLAPKERTLSEMKKFLKSCCMTCETFTNISEALSVNEILNNLSYTPKVANQVDRYSLVLRYYSYVNPFYFLNDSVNTQELHAKLHSLHFRKGYTFQIPPIVELQDHFRYINDFLFSSVFFDLIITAFIRWYISPLVSRSLLDHLLLAAMMCLCFILKLSQDPKINTEYLERKLFWFGRHKLLGNQSFLEVLIAEHHSIQNPITHSAVSYYIELSNLPR
ncbi:hypothetical protein RF11_00512 [Thelohanellus kitauei]|uniref:E3 ubiquitin-protein ligase n=1 Tax=Thelohanellus kitauei TaxID=669202 RepID=A0A0C2N723_THEKT|nr:hypothetical protein RF11_00512 [Thelohanellus kitauei]